MSSAGGRSTTPAKTASAKRAAPEGGKKVSKPGLLRNWGIIALVAFGIWAVFFGIPALMRNVNAPPISEDFGIEDAVVALRLDADEVSYLVLVNEAGETRSVQLDERGFEESGLAWSEAGLSTGGPTDEYLLRDDGLTRLPLPAAGEAPSERGRFALGDGFAVYTGSAEGQQLAFVDAAADELTAVDAGYTSTALAACGEELVLVGETGVRTVTAETTDFDGLGVFDGVQALVCEQDRLYGLDEIVSDESTSHQTLRVWDRATGASSSVEIRYPEAVSAWTYGAPFVWEGRLYWTAQSTLWSVPLVSKTDTVEAEAAADLSGFIGDYWPVVRTDEGVLVEAGGRVFGVADDTDFINPSRGESYDKLLGLAIFSADVGTGERRIEIEVDGIDFPRKDLHVTAIAVDPEWAAER
ncbi:hypothetical protein QFZ53_000997 [Microbacterium natoriense]|uniref:WD40 repeat domain-containing protein n=1 Tax=Microbacterium natoriense TaxID=284570 RepID=A0AAW8EX60_9MICO|nr:hypothetical protein [Microbacterium natoriense]MDQ0646801.1 hypothetical protein [Microbacterium natoriense]